MYFFVKNKGLVKKIKINLKKKKSYVIIKTYFNFCICIENINGQKTTSSTIGKSTNYCSQL